MSSLGWIPSSDDDFGYAIATGDINLDEIDDIAIGAPGKNGQQGGFAVFASASHDFSSAITGYWMGSLEDTRCSGSSTIHLYMAQEATTGKIEGWAYNENRFNIFAYEVPLEGATTYTGCYPLGGRSACTDNIFFINNGFSIDTDTFVVELIVPWYPGGGASWPMRFERVSSDTFVGQCDSSVNPGLCDHTYLRVTMTWQNDYYNDHSTHCLTECQNE